MLTYVYIYSKYLSEWFRTVMFSHENDQTLLLWLSRVSCTRDHGCHRERRARDFPSAVGGDRTQRDTTDRSPAPLSAADRARLEGKQHRAAPAEVWRLQWLNTPVFYIHQPHRSAGVRPFPSSPRLCPCSDPDCSTLSRWCCLKQLTLTDETTFHRHLR